MLRVTLDEIAYALELGYDVNIEGLGRIRQVPIKQECVRDDQKYRLRMRFSHSFKSRVELTPVPEEHKREVVTDLDERRAAWRERNLALAEMKKKLAAKKDGAAENG